MRSYPLRPPTPAAKATGLRAFLNGLPSAVFEASSPGRRFGLGQRAATYIKLGLEYSLGGCRVLLRHRAAPAAAGAGRGTAAGGALCRTLLLQPCNFP